MLETICRGANGKVDRREVLEQVGHTPVAAPTGALPRTVPERAIAEVWRRHLRLPAVGRDANFFDLGGTSLLLLRVQADLRSRVSSVPDVLTLYDRPTIAELAVAIDGAGSQQRALRGQPVSSRARERARRVSARRAAGIYHDDGQP